MQGRQVEAYELLTAPVWYVAESDPDFGFITNAPWDVVRYQPAAPSPYLWDGAPYHIGGCV